MDWKKFSFYKIYCSANKLDKNIKYFYISNSLVKTNLNPTFKKKIFFKKELIFKKKSFKLNLIEFYKKSLFQKIGLFYYIYIYKFFLYDYNFDNSKNYFIFIIKT